MARMVAPARSDFGRILPSEMVISLIVNMAMAAGMGWLLTDLATTTSGRFYDAFDDMVKTTMGASMGCVLGITFGIRRRIRDGKINPQAARQFLPQNALLRALLIGAIASIVLGIPGAAVVAYWLSPTTPTLMTFLLVKICYGAVYGLVVTPFIVLAAVRDR
jgi:hypothetical protein